MFFFANFQMPTVPLRVRNPLGMNSREGLEALAKLTLIFNKKNCSEKAVFLKVLAGSDFNLSYMGLSRPSNSDRASPGRETELPYRHCYFIRDQSFLAQWLIYFVREALELAAQVIKN